MGYGIVLSLNDHMVRGGTFDGPSLVGHLREVLGPNRYPVGDRSERRSGPWQAAGAFHTNEQVAFNLTSEGIVALPATKLDTVDLEGPLSGPDPLFERALTASDHAGMVRELRRHPERHHRLAASGDVLTGYFGPDRSGRSIVSAWWFYADAIGSLPDQAGDTIRAMVDSRDDHSVSAGSFSNALNKVGALVTATSVSLVWSGNRLCRPAQLTADEKVRLSRRLAY